MEGAVESWNALGFGIIRGENGLTYHAHYKDFERYKKAGARVSLEIGDDVTFTPAVDEVRGGRRKAGDIQYDSRSALFRFAFFRRFEDAIEELATHVYPREKWASSSFDEASALVAVSERARTSDWLSEERRRQAEKFGSVDEAKAEQAVQHRVRRMVLRKKYDVLFSYFERTFERVQLEKKIVCSDAGAVFNTGLGNKFDKDIYALFKRQPGGDGYLFDRFGDENQVGKVFPEIPEPANYFWDAATGTRVPVDHLIFDYERKILPDYHHLLDERRSRFPESWQKMSDQECTDTLDMLLTRTRSRVRRNFHAAVPVYYPAMRRIQMLLPLTFSPGTTQEETRALVVSREGAGYCVETIMPLHWAYRNARLLTKPDRDDWLDF